MLPSINYYSFRSQRGLISSTTSRFFYPVKKGVIIITMRWLTTIFHLPPPVFVRNTIRKGRTTRTYKFRILRRNRCQALPHIRVSTRRTIYPINIRRNVTTRRLTQTRDPFKGKTRRRSLLTNFPGTHTNITRTIYGRLFRTHVPIIISRFGPTIISRCNLCLKNVFRPIRSWFRVIFPVKMRRTRRHWKEKISKTKGTTRQARTHTMRRTQALGGPNNLIGPKKANRNVAIPRGRRKENLPNFSRRSGKMVHRVPRLQVVILSNISLFRCHLIKEHSTRKKERNQPFPMFERFRIINHCVPMVPHTIHPFRPFTNGSRRRTPYYHNRGHFLKVLP